MFVLYAVPIIKQNEMPIHEGGGIQMISTLYSANGMNLNILESQGFEGIWDMSLALLWKGETFLPMNNLGGRGQLAAQCYAFLCLQRTKVIGWKSDRPEILIPHPP